MSYRWRARTIDTLFADHDEKLRGLLAPPVPRPILADPWDGTTFAPEWRASTDPDIGDGVLVGSYVLVGRHLFVRLVLVAGAVTAFGSGDWWFPLPFGLTAAVPPAGHLLLDGRATVAGDRLVAQGEIGSGGADRIFVVSQSSASTVLDVVDSAYPDTWAAGDSLELHGVIPLT